VDTIWQGLLKAIELIITGDSEVMRIILLTLRVSGTATLISVLIGIPTGILLALIRFRGRRLIVSMVNTGMGLPPVVVGLWVSVMLWRYGPLGVLGMMYTPTAMIVAQCVIAMPIVVGFTLAGIQQLNPKLRLQIMAMGASRWQVYWLLIREARLAILAAVIAGFGGAISEVGASMMVGGNVLGETRVATTAIVMEVGKGNFDDAMALSLLLLGLAWGVTYALTLAQQRERLT
jgi:tungstate transport system permease protein